MPHNKRQKRSCIKKKYTKNKNSKKKKMKIQKLTMSILLSRSSRWLICTLFSHGILGSVCCGYAFSRIAKNKFYCEKVSNKSVERLHEKIKAKKVGEFCQK